MKQFSEININSFNEQYELISRIDKKIDFLCKYFKLPLCDWYHQLEEMIEMNDYKGWQLMAYIYFNKSESIIENIKMIANGHS